jgi:hypothetical protein
VLLTVAVKVTPWPYSGAVSDEATLVVVFAGWFSTTSPI